MARVNAHGYLSLQWTIAAKTAVYKARANGCGMALALMAVDQVSTNGRGACEGQRLYRKASKTLFC